MANNKMLDEFRAARLRSVPLIAIETPDIAETIRGILGVLNGAAADTPVMEWDIVRGLNGVNEAGKKEARRLAQNPLDTVNPVEMLVKVEKAAKKAMIIMHNAARFIDEPTVIQAIWNLRDKFKEDFRTVVLMAAQIRMPVELARDVVILEEAMPTDQTLRDIATNLMQGAGLDLPDERTLETTIRAARGMSAFEAEQALAMALQKTGVDQDELWERKRKTIEATDGLKLIQEAEGFGEIGGNEAIKYDVTRIFQGKRRPTAVIWIDELEKALDGAFNGALDGGASKDQLGFTLTKMETMDATGYVFGGVAGSGKSMLAKAIGRTFKVPVIQLDYGALKGGIVGESERKIRAAFRVIEAVAGKDALFVATCNKWETMPPELGRRFRLGFYFFDLPDQEERQTIWGIMLKRFGLNAKERRPDDDGWTGAEIRNCCELAWRLDISLIEAATRVIPVSQRDPQMIERLRKAADGSFLSASKPGAYAMQDGETTGRRGVSI